MTKPGLAPRRSALWLLGQVTGEGRLLSELLPRALEKLPPEDRARAQRLTIETLRWADRADRVLKPFLKKAPSLPVRNALRMAVVEMAVDGAAAHGVVDAAVTLMGETKKTKPAAGLANAVLRKVDVAAWDRTQLPKLPNWLRGPLIAGYGRRNIEAMEAAHAAGAPLDLTPKDGDAAALAARVGGVALPTGSVRLDSRSQVTALPGFDSGDWWVQDAAAAIPARALAGGLAPATGARVLDMCAAPGGKTMQLAAAGAEVTALDLSEHRMTRVAENLARTGLSAKTVTADAIEWTPDAPFDAILLDAPCSATGTIRRHPDLPHARDGAEFAGLFALQEAMLDRAVDWLKPGGLLVYCTCSLLPDEGEVQIEEALTRHPGLRLDTDLLRVPGVEDGWLCDEGLRLTPDLWKDRGGMDGFFIAALRKDA